MDHPLTLLDLHQIIESCQVSEAHRVPLAMVVPIRTSSRSEEDASPDVPVLKEAKAEYTKLK